MRSRLARLDGWVRPALCVVAVVFAVREVQSYPDPLVLPTWLAAVLLASCGLTMVFSLRWAALPMALTALAGFLLDDQLRFSLLFLVIVWAVVYLPVASRRMLWLVSGSLGAAGVGLLVLTLARPGSSLPQAELLTALGLVALPLSVGLARRAQRKRVVVGAGELARLEASLAAVREGERARLVDELHATVSARLDDVQELLRNRPAGPDPAPLTALLERIDVASRAALVEMRLVMQVLMDQDDSARADEDLARADTLRSSIEAANQELAERGVAAHIPLPEDSGRLSLATERTLARVVREAVVPLLRSTSRPELALVTMELLGDVAQVRVQLADPLVVSTEALDARLELLGGVVERSENAIGGSQLVVRVPQGEHVAQPAGRHWRKLHWGLMVQVLVVVMMLAVNLQQLEAEIRLETLLVVVLALRPEAGMVAALCWLAFTAVVPPQQALSLGLAAAALLVVAGMRLRGWLLAVVPFAVLMCLVALRVRSGQPDMLIDDLTLDLPALLLGLAIRRQQDRSTAQDRRRRELEERREQILAEVRTDLSRDLHDVVAHQLSVVTLQIMGHRDSSDPEELDLVLDRVQGATQQAQRELEALGRVVLVGGGVDGVLMPSQMLQRMTEELNAAGNKISARMDPALDDQPVSVRRSVVRLLQEGTTNVLRHAAPGAPVELEVRLTGSHEHPVGVEFVMANPHHDGPGRVPALSSGLGLRGLADRVELTGGQLRAGRQGDRWVLRAFLPVN